MESDGNQEVLTFGLDCSKERNQVLKDYVCSPVQPLYLNNLLDCVYVNTKYTLKIGWGKKFGLNTNLSSTLT